MKRLFLLIISAVLGCTAGYSLPNATVLLQHKGNVVVYGIDSLQAALRDAVDGDTVFLSKGKYFSDITIDKKITLRGEGVQTLVGSIRVDIPDSVTLTQTLLEGLNMISLGECKIVVAQSVNGLSIKQCHFEDIDFYGIFRDVLIDRCLCNSFKIPNNQKNSVRSMIVRNTKIYELYPIDVTTKEISFINCDIRQFYYSGGSFIRNFRGSLINCIVGDGSRSSFMDCMLINNLLLNKSSISGTAVNQNCYRIEVNDLFKNNYVYFGTNHYESHNDFKCIYSDEELLEKGYIGNNGTVVGSGGGSTPYTLELAVPYVKESDIKLDSEKRVLNVMLTLSAE